MKSRSHLFVCVVPALILVFGIAPQTFAQCTDADGDGFCATTDCDDANPNCTTDCTDADSDGFCATTDCNDVNSTIPIPTTSWWPGDGNAIDVSGGHYGTLVNGVTFVPGVVGQAFNIDGPNPHVDFGDVLNEIEVPFSVEAWIKTPGASTYMGIFTTDDENIYSGVRFVVKTNDQLLIYYGDGAGSGDHRRAKSSATTIPLNTWTHVAGVVRGPTDMSLYIDGIDAGGSYSGTASGMVHTSAPARIGLVRTADFKGSIDEVGLYDWALTADEIRTIYEAGSAGKWCIETICDGLDDNGNGVVDEGCDRDGDGYCNKNMTVVGTPAICPSGGGDCDDFNATCTTNCTDGDGDGFCVTADCDDTRSECSVDCTDFDSDGLCADSDCDDSNPSCTTDCTDADTDGLAACAGDCDDANIQCTTDCTDNDGDGYCLTTDCDDANPGCTSDCTDTDGDGSCAPNDCNEADPQIHPGVPETCNGQDDDCNGAIDDDPACDRTCESPEMVGNGTPLVAPPTGSDHTIVWTGTEYGFAWSDPRDGNDEIYFARFDVAGTRIGGEVRVTDDPNGSTQPSLVWTGTDFGVGWQDSRDGNTEVYFARLDATGAKIGSDIRVTTDAGTSQRPSIAWTGQEYGLSWIDDRTGDDQLYFVRLDSAGGRIGSDVQLTSTEGTIRAYSTLIWAGTGYGLAYQGTVAGTYFRRLDSQGNPIGNPTLATTAADEPSCNMVWTGSGYGLVTVSGHDVIFTVLDATGGIVAEDTVAFTYTVDYPSIAWTGAEFGVVWAHYFGIPGGQELFFVRFDPSGNRISVEQVQLTDDGNSLYDDNRATLVWTGSDYGLLYTHNWIGSMFARVACECAVTGDGDGDGLCASIDCDDSNANCTMDCPPGLLVCPPVSRCTDVDGDAYCVTHDCDDTDINNWTSCNGCNDYDSDGFFTGCDAYTSISGPDCDSGNPRCTSDCTDADEDQFCVTHDCDDTLYICNYQCMDNDMDGLYVCEGDCDDNNPNCQYLCTDADQDGFCKPFDCDEANPNCTTDCADADLDGFCVTTDCDEANPNCTTDCTDGDADGFCVFDDCDDGSSTCTVDCADVDADGFWACEECDDTRDDVYPGAVQLCDGINNDCNEPGWPTPPVDEADADGDGYRVCAGDCHDAEPKINPQGWEICNDLDDDCDGLTDEDALGEDSDGDIVANLCDNCPADPNTSQDDFDSDGVGDICDNCVFDRNIAQADFDADLEGDRCDNDDGLIYLYFDVADRIDWDNETGFDTWNCYVGDFDVLKSSGIYTQAPGSNPLADRGCSLSNPYMDVLTTPGPGEVAFHLATGMSGGVESSLGNDSSGTQRPNDGACAPLP